MPWPALEPNVDAALRAVIAYIHDEYAPIGIVACGSLVRGGGGRHSDLDMCVVHRLPWRQRAQRRFNGVPVEVFVNPATASRASFVAEHAAGRPSLTHMFATGVVVYEADTLVSELIAEAKGWLSRPPVLAEHDVTRLHYAIVDLLDDLRDVDAVSGALLSAAVVDRTIAALFWKHGLHQPRRKDIARSVAAVDPVAAGLLTRFAAAAPDERLGIVEALVRHVIGVDRFFEWTSERGPA